MCLFGISEAARWLERFTDYVGFGGRNGAPGNWAYQLSIGYLIDWLDAGQTRKGLERALERATFGEYPLNSIAHYSQSVRRAKSAANSMGPIQLESPRHL